MLRWASKLTWSRGGRLGLCTGRKAYLIQGGPAGTAHGPESLPGPGGTGPAGTVHGPESLPGPGGKGRLGLCKGRKAHLVQGAAWNVEIVASTRRHRVSRVVLIEKRELYQM